VSDPYVGTRTLMRAFLDSVLPPGSAWNPVPGGDLDHLLDGMGDALQAVYDSLGTLDDIRNPRTTPFLDELEREYGVSPNVQLTDAVRRAYLLRRKYGRPSGTPSGLQAELDATGFGTGGYGLKVFANDPAVNPAFFTTQICQSFCGGPNAYCGYSSNPLPTGTWSAIVWDGTVWVAVSTDGQCATSPDLIVWTAQTITNHQWSAICLFGSSLCVVSTDGACSTSANHGVTWTAQTMTAGAWNAVVYTGTQLVVVGAGPTNYCATSPTGVTWTAQAGLAAGAYTSLVWNGTFLLAGGSNVLATSPTAVTWTPRAITAYFVISSMDWNGTIFCAVGSFAPTLGASGGSATSADGITWVVTNPLASAAAYRSIKWVAPLNLWVLVGQGGFQCLTSPNGVSWTRQAIPSGSWTCVAWNGTTLAAVGTAAIQLSSSTNAITWTIQGTGTAGAAFCGFLGGGTWIVNGDSFTGTPGYYGCGMTVECCGYTTLAGVATACCGYFATLIYSPVVIPPPPDSWSWQMVFFLAAAVLRDSGGYIVGTTNARIPTNLRQQLVEIVLRIKGMHSWAVLMADFN
jgi:hypothetical protein